MVTDVSDNLVDNIEETLSKKYKIDLSIKELDEIRDVLDSVIDKYIEEEE